MNIVWTQNAMADLTQLVENNQRKILLKIIRLINARQPWLRRVFWLNYMQNLKFLCYNKTEVNVCMKRMELYIQIIQSLC